VLALDQDVSGAFPRPVKSMSIRVFCHLFSNLSSFLWAAAVPGKTPENPVRLSAKGVLNGIEMGASFLSLPPPYLFSILFSKT